MSFAALPERDIGLIFIEATICLLITITSLIGNILVCIAVYRNQSLRTSTNLYIIALATADLLAAAIVMPMTLTVLISGTWILGPFLCDFHAFFVSFVLYVSPITMALTAFNRYTRIVKSNHYKLIFSKWRSRIMLGGAWLFVACYVVVPKLSGLQKYGFIPAAAICHVLHLSKAGALAHYYIGIGLFLLTPITITIICYRKVSTKIRQHNLEVAPTIQSQQGAISVHEIKVSKSLFVVVLAFVMCWTPGWTVAVMFRLGLVTSIPRGVTLFCILSTSISSAVNPFIYAGMNRSFRQEFKKILKFGRSNVAPAVAPTDETPLQGSSSNRGPLHVPSTTAAKSTTSLPSDKNEAN